MLLKRLRQDAARENWFGVVLDLVILILGVFLGMQVNNWNAARLEDNKGEAYRARLTADLEANLKDLDNRQLYYTVTRKHAQAALDSLGRPASEDPAKFLVDTYQASQIAPRKLRRFTYDEVVSSGNVEILGDAKLRSRLANYYTDASAIEVIFDNVPPYREHLRFVMPAGAQRVVRTQCPEVVQFDEDGASTTTLATDCRIDLDQSKALADAAVVRAIPNLRSDLTRLIADKDVKLEFVAALRKHLVLLKRQIASID